MSAILIPDMSHPHYVLEVDGLLLTAARDHARRAKLPKSRIDPLERRLDRLQALFDDPDRDHEGLESAAIQAEGAYSELAAAYTPVLRRCAQAHICAAVAVEAHLNRRILKRLAKAPDLQDVMWQPPVEKMQELLSRCGRGSLGERQRPLPQFAELIKTRNALVHYKPRRLDVHDTRLPKIPPRLGLDPARAKKSVQTAEEVITTIAERLGERPPPWVDRQAYSVFSYETD